MIKTKKQAGFTIVELLIVIVIIGILAALVIVAYNGIQQRARNTARITSAKELQKLLSAYIAQEGKYPSITTNACIGTGYTDWGGDGTLDCWVKATSEYHPSALIDSELQKVATIPKVETGDVKGAYTFRGYLYYPNQTIDGQAGRIMLAYFLEGLGQNCGIPGILTPLGGTNYATNGAINTYSIYGVTYCYAAVAEP